MTISLPPETSSPPRLQPSGWLRYFSFSVDHKVIGLQYLVCGFVFYLIGGAFQGFDIHRTTLPFSDIASRNLFFIRCGFLGELAILGSAVALMVNFKLLVWNCLKTCLLPHVISLIKTGSPAEVTS